LDQQFKTFKAALVAGGLYLAGDTSGQGIPYYPVRGNHETYNAIHPEENPLQVWMDNFGNYLPQNGPAGEQGLTYAFTCGNGVFLVVDEYIHDMTVNQAWVNQQLAANAGKQQVFAIGHAPAFKLVEEECLADNPAARDALLTSLYKAGERVFLAGHDHLSARADVPVVDSTGAAIGTMEQIITPSGAPFSPTPWDGKYLDNRVVPREYVDATMGYQLVKVDGPKVTVEFWGTTDGCTRTWDPATQEYKYTYSTDSSGWRWSKVDSYSYSLP
jgi:3',5'-cyclic AMP phosphodiesterase CpdA